MDSVCTQCGAALSAPTISDESNATQSAIVCPVCNAYVPQVPVAPLPDGALLNFSISTLVSICIHTAGLIGIALCTWPAISAHEEDLGTEVAIALLPSETLSEARDESLELDEVSNIRQENEQLDEADLLVDGVSAAMGELYADNSLGILAPSGAAGGAHTQVEVLTGGGGALDGEATFMGLQAQGRRFCIIADRSGSMFGTKFEYLKTEILATLDGMRGHTRLQIIFFNTRALPYPKPDWLAPRAERDAVQVWLDGLVADGDTYPTPAFVEAFSLEPLPDAIFFMTDGRFDARAVNQIQRLNRVAQRVVPIHTITFVDRGAEPMMRKIAEDSGGKYRHVDGAAP